MKSENLKRVINNKVWLNVSPTLAIEDWFALSSITACACEYMKAFYTPRPQKKKQKYGRWKASALLR
jgi:hypothetical protein